MPQQTISYNSFTFPYTRLSVREEPIYAQDKFTQEGTAFTFEVRGHVVGDTPSDLKAQLTCMRARLMAPRKEFYVDWTPEGGGSAERFWGFDDTGNLAWGPLPGDLQLNEFAGGRAAMYSWSMTVAVKDCANGCTIASGYNAVLSVSRSYVHTVDSNGFTTRTVAGKLVVDSISARAGKPADYFRFTVIPTLPTNYKRESQSFVQSEDGRELTFAITDVEQMWTLPKPISSGNASFSVRLRDLGMMADYALSGEFKAPASVSKTTILQKIFDLAAAKFPLNAPGFFFEDMQFDDDVFGNAIRFSITAISAAANTTGSGTDSFPIQALNALTTAPQSNGIAQQILPYGGDGTVNSGVTAKTPTIYDACNATTDPNAGSDQIPAGTGGTQGNTRTVNTEILNATNNGASQDHLNNPIESFHERFSYEVDNHVVVFPVKVKSQNHKTQQTCAPTLTIIQAGYLTQYAKRAADVVKIPRPMNLATLPADFRILHAYESPASAEPVGAGKWSLYRIEWRYVLQYVRYAQDAALQEPEFKPSYPRDLRRPDGGQEVLADPPQIVQIPT